VLLPGTVIYCVFCSFGPFWTPIFGRFFGGIFPLFWGFLKSAFPRFQIGCMTHFKVADGQVPIADTTREPALFWIFNS
jgi:hypothetical protein